MNITVPISFLTTVFTGRMPRSGIAGSYGNFIFILLRNLNTILHSGCSNLQSLQLCRRIHFSTHHLQHLLFIDFFNDGNSEEYEVISHCSFDFHFSIDQWCWTSFHVFICPLYIFFGEISFTHFELCCWFLLSFRNSLYILDISSLLDTWFANIDFHSVGCLFTLWIVSFDAQNF